MVVGGVQGLVMGVGSLLSRAAVASRSGVLYGGATSRRTMSRRTMSVSTVVAAAAVVMLAHFPSGADAHNWLHTPGRARKEASTLKPCRGRKTSDTHGQIGPGQKVVMKWATGHTRASYIVVVKGEDAGWMRHKKFMDYVKDYVRRREREKEIKKGRRREIRNVCV